MADILLIDTGEPLSSELQQFLRSRQHTVSVRPTASVAIKEINANRATYDVIVLNMSHNQTEDWTALEELHQLLQHTPGSPRILCLSTVYWGPSLQLAIERKGGRLVYIR
jgi:DNA-binding NarL/FixJ family response regulator